MSGEPLRAPQNADPADLSPEARARQEAAALRARNERLQEEQRVLEVRRRDMRRGIHRLKVRVLWCSIVLWARELSDRVTPWRMGSFLVATTVFGAICALLIPKMVVFILGAILGAAVFALLLLVPNDEIAERNRLDRAADLARSIAEHAAFAGNVERHADEVRAVGQKFEETAEELRRKQLMESTGARRRQLCERDWKALRGTQFETFLATVFEELGYDVELPAKGDRGADFIVSNGRRRICVQIQSEGGGASERAVQNAHYAMAGNRCDACAVITNRIATLGARELGNAIGCIVVDEDSMPALILGEVIL